MSRVIVNMEKEEKCKMKISNNSSFGGEKNKFSQVKDSSEVLLADCRYLSKRGQYIPESLCSTKKNCFYLM